jgi:hypothetical protein
MILARRGKREVRKAEERGKLTRTLLGRGFKLNRDINAPQALIKNSLVTQTYGIQDCFSVVEQYRVDLNIS